MCVQRCAGFFRHSYFYIDCSLLTFSYNHCSQLLTFFDQLLHTFSYNHRLLFLINHCLFFHTTTAVHCLLFWSIIAYFLIQSPSTFLINHCLLFHTFAVYFLAAHLAAYLECIKYISSASSVNQCLFLSLHMRIVFESRIIYHIFV